MNRPFYQYIVPTIWPLFLLAANWTEIPAQAGARLIIGMVIGSVILYAYYRRLLAENLAAMAVSAASVFWYMFPATWWELIIWIVEVLVVFLVIFRAKHDMGRMIPLLNVSATIILTVLLICFINGRKAYASPEIIPIQDDETPDIYLIIPDSYGRSDILQSAFGYDNSGFLDGLRERGFTVDECAVSNYARTDYSMASMLNMDYIETDDREAVIDMLRHSTVRASLEGIGYETVAFETGFRWSEIIDADHYLTPAATAGMLNEFEAVFLDRTPLRLLSEAMGVTTLYGDLFRERTTYLLERLPDVARMDGPQFVFAHIIPPHPPFVFNADGSPADFYAYLTAGGENHDAYTFDAYRDGYTTQMDYLNAALLRVIDELLASDQPPIILLLADHGPWKVPAPGMYQTLAAYYGVTPRPCSTPVNAFRLVFDQRFGVDLELVPDEMKELP